MDQTSAKTDNKQNKTQIMEKVINAMKEHPLIWNVGILDYHRPLRNEYLRKFGKQIGITGDKMAHLISYVKKRYVREAAREKRSKMGIPSREVIPRHSWRWYKHCEFLQSRQSKTPKYLQLAKDSGCLKDTTNATNEMEEDVGLPSPLSPGLSDDEANEAESMQADEIDYVEDENQLENIVESIQYQMDTKSDDFEEAENSSSIQNIDESTEHEDAPESKESCDQDDDGTMIYEDNREFIISGICSTITHHLSNADYTDDDIVDFHGDLLMYLYKTIHKT